MKAPARVACAVIVGAIACLGQSNRIEPEKVQQITVKDYVITGADNLSTSELAGVRQSVVGRSGGSKGLRERARLNLAIAMNHGCYILPKIRMEEVPLGPFNSNQIVFRATVQPGIRFRLREFHIDGAKAIPASEVEQVLPISAMREGDCSGLRPVQSTVMQLYRDRGFRDVKVTPYLKRDCDIGSFDLTVKIEEGDPSPARDEPLPVVR